MASLATPVAASETQRLLQDLNILRRDLQQKPLTPVVIRNWLHPWMVLAFLPFRGEKTKRDASQNHFSLQGAQSRKGTSPRETFRGATLRTECIPRLMPLQAKKNQKRMLYSATQGVQTWKGISWRPRLTRKLLWSTCIPRVLPLQGQLSHPRQRSQSLAAPPGRPSPGRFPTSSTLSFVQDLQATLLRFPSLGFQPCQLITNITSTSRNFRITLDLGDKNGQEIILKSLREGDQKSIGAAPPCGTATRAREKPISAKKRKGARAPPQLRSDAHPRGIPREYSHIHRSTPRGSIRQTRSMTS